MSLMLESAGWALLVCWIASSFVAPRQRRLSYGLGAAANAAFALAEFLQPSAWGVINAVACGFYLWLWWKSGGGDDTKRRLRKLGRAFAGVRRTAPAAARVIA
jgi:hypothetical protein